MKLQVNSHGGFILNKSLADKTDNNEFDKSDDSETSIKSVNLNDDLIFQILDWRYYHEENDEGQKLYTIRLFGRTNENKTVYAKINKYTPFFYVKLPDGWKQSMVDILINEIKKRVRKESSNGLKSYRIVQRYDMVGFTNYKLFNFLELTFYDLDSMRSYEWTFKNPQMIYQISKNPIKLKIYESNIEPFLRCMHIRNLDSVGWVKIEKGKFERMKDDSKSHSEINVETSWMNLIKYNERKILPLVIASFDIECMSEDGSFPQAYRDGDKIIQIGVTYSRFGEYECYYKHILTLGTCSPIDGVTVESCTTEEEVLLGFTKLIRKTNPDIMTGYNINGFDFEYLKDRSKKLGIFHKFSRLSRIAGEICNFEEKKLASSALGENILKYYDMTGRVIIDLMKVVQRDHRLPSYKLDSVASHFIQEKIDKLESKPDENKTIIYTSSAYGVRENQYITINYNDGITDNKHMEGKKFKILKITDHMIDVKDKKGNIVKQKQFIIITNNVATTEIMGKGYTVCWCQAKDDVTPQDIFRLQKGSADDRAIVAKYCVMDCELCNKLMAKLQILTNNIGMANVCHVPLSYIFMRGQGVKIFSLVSKKCREMKHLIPVLKKKKPKTDEEIAQLKKAEKKLHATLRQINGDDDPINNEEDEEDDGYEGAIVFDPVTGVHFDPIPVLDYASLYPNAMILRNLSHECFVNDPRYDNLPGYRYHTITYNNNNGTSSTCRFAEKLDGSKGIIPIILTDLLDQRAKKKDEMENEKDGFMKSVLDGLQLAYKVTANSLYGQTGATTSAIFMKEIAASTTATGREMLIFSKHFIEGEFDVNNKCIKETIFGRIINFALEDKEKYIKLMKEIYNVDPFFSLQIPEKKFNKPKDGWTNKQEFIDVLYKKINEVMIGKCIKPQIIYGDSVTPETPILMRKKINESYITEIKTIDTIGNNWKEYNAFKKDQIDRTNKQQDEEIDYEVWTDKGWSKIKRVIRHKTNKKLYEVLTHTGCVRVTEDHSLLDKDGKIIKPTDCKIGTELLHSFPEIENSKESKISKNKAYIYGFFFGDGSCGKYGEKAKVKYSWALNNSDVKLNIELKQKLENVYKKEFKILDTLKSSGVYKIVPSHGTIKTYVDEYRKIFYDKDKHKTVPIDILNGSFEEKESFLEGYYAADGCRKDTEKIGCHRFDVKGQISAMHMFYLVKSLGFNASINNRTDKPEIYRINYSKKKFRKNECAIKKIRYIGMSSDYVYDLETEVGHFHAGIGQMIVKNTDSVFFNANITDLATGEKMKNKEGLKLAIELGQLASHCICALLPDPMKQVYEKVLWPFMILTKKRYVGNLYEYDPNKFKQKSMGIVLKRRDNAPIVKVVCGGIVNEILNNHSAKGAVDFTRKSLKEILSNKFPIEKFVVTKTLKENYKKRNQIVHAVLADRMAKRDPGNKPMPNDRIPYVYVIKKGKINLQGERVETPDYVIKNKIELDYLFYITNQIMKPAIQFLELFVENPNAIFDEYMIREKNRRKGKKPAAFYLNGGFEKKKDDPDDSNDSNSSDSENDSNSENEDSDNDEESDNEDDEDEEDANNEEEEKAIRKSIFNMADIVNDEKILDEIKIKKRKPGGHKRRLRECTELNDPVFDEEKGGFIIDM
jgi:DNA polymerase elongation subunit (family B)